MKNILPRLLRPCLAETRLAIMMKFIKKNPSSSSSFADFMNNASSAEKKKVYKDVLRKAAERQQAVVDSAKAVSGC